MLTPRSRRRSLSSKFYRGVLGKGQPQGTTTAKGFRTMLQTPFWCVWVHFSNFSGFLKFFCFFLLIWCSDCFGGVLWYFGGFPGFYRFLLFSTFFCGLVRFGAFSFDFYGFSSFFAFFGGFGCQNDSKR